jgi:2-polyprenyl-6-methoxyphenol hydroxylase-like FAD-dependent oxidoreductase
VVIAGGGVLGTMHAVMARRRGFEVVQLEREAEARGASVRRCPTRAGGSSSCWIGRPSAR